ncbi:hypothetical protein WG915_05130 [Corynebacterium sp. H128]|uniref:hypothetical protein n=1 Tax=Corynebacterium sp. H128 TaxID=3133427 RepID=UPI00309D10FC
MKDPTRIPKLLGQVQDLWEALPQLDFADLLRLLDNSGVGGLDDADAAEALQQLGQRYPRTVQHTSVAVTVRTQEHLLSLDAETVVVRSSHARAAQRPVTWALDEVIKAEVGAPLILRDTTGIRRRFGVVEQIRPLIDAPKLSLTHLPALDRRTLGEDSFVVSCEGDVTVSLAHALRTFHQQRRNTTMTELPWDLVLPTAVGEQLVVQLRDGGGNVDLGRITAITRAS